MTLFTAVYILGTLAVVLILHCVSVTRNSNRLDAIERDLHRRMDRAVNSVHRDAALRSSADHRDLL